VTSRGAVRQNPDTELNVEIDVKNMPETTGKPIGTFLESMERIAQLTYPLCATTGRTALKQKIE